MKKKSFMALGIISFLFVLIVGSVSIFMSYRYFEKVSTELTAFKLDFKNETLKQQREEQKEKKEAEEASIEFVTIGSRYLIRDTSNISNAYLKGDPSLLTDEKEKETLRMATAVLKEVTTSTMSLYDKELAIHNWMLEHIDFDSGSLLAVPSSSQYCDQPYGVLKYGKAVCVGYATTFKLFMNMLGVDCMIIHDNEQSHSWNIVNLEGDWYLVDVTFDDTSSTTSTPHSYRYFNTTDAAFLSNHSWNQDLYPSATGTKYSNAVKNAKPLKDLKKLPTLVRKAMDTSNTTLFYRIAANTNLEYANAILDGIRYRTTDTLSLDYCLSTSDTTDYILCIYITYFNDNPITSPSYQLTPDEEDILNNLFGGYVN